MSSKGQRDKNQNIQVFVRVRPLNATEKNNKSCIVVDCPNNKEVVVKERPTDRFTRTFTFDRVFGPNSRQIDVYMSVVHPMISEVLAGYNCTVFAYGQTGTGKTFTMEGERTDDVAISWYNDPLTGIIPRALSNLFDELRIQQVEFTVRVSFLELYNEELVDLLSPNDDASKIRLFEDAMKKGSVIIQGLEEVMVDNKNEVYSIMEKGSVKRQTAATLMNAQSSRSHTVFSITVHIKENSVEGEELLKTGKLNLVDLAGSENIGRSGAVDKRAREAGNINQSLLTLGRVITALVERAPHIPYRESKLTRLLQDSLGGRTKTSIIATISPASCNNEETLSTLDYAYRARNITNRPEINQKLTKKTLIKVGNYGGRVSMGPAYWILTTIVFVFLAFFVLTLNYFAHKEYTAEIERLRRDLAATRDKNGVFLANDNYTKMVMQLEQQEQEISQFLSQIKALKEEMEKKEAICNQLNMSLEVCNTKLVTTFTKLEATEQKLSETSEKLNDRVNECIEKTHLIEKHVETEQTLAQQAQSLLTVADVATSDTQKLHDKLARKRSVETLNDDVTRDFHVSFVQNVAHMEDSLNRFTQDDIKFCSALQTNLGERLEKRSVELTSLSNEMSSFVESQTQLIQHLEKMFSNQVSGSLQWIQQFLITIRSTSDGEVNNLHKFLTETFLVPMRNMARQLQLIGAEIQTSTRAITDQVQQRMDAVKTFEASQREALSHHIENVALHLKQQKQALAMTEEGFREVDETTNDYKEALKDSVQQLKVLADSLLATFGNTENHLNDNKSKIKSGLSVAREKCEHVSTMSTALEQQLKRRTEHFTAYETQAEEMLDSVGSSKEALDQLITGAERFGEELEDGVRAHISNGETSWTNHYSAIEQEMRKYSENLNGELQRELKQTQVLMAGLRESAESHEAILEQQRIDFGTFVRERQDDLDSHCSYISSWSQTIASELQLRNQEMDKFLVEDLRKDFPTGKTPERREFEYPRQLAVTSPRERILARFREMRDAASSFKISDENIKERESFNERRQALSSGSSSSDDASLDVGSLNNVRSKSMSVSDLPSTSESILNTSLHSEPPTLKKNDNKENTSSSLRKYHSEDFKHKKQQIRPKNTSSTRKALTSQNY